MDIYTSQDFMDYYTGCYTPRFIVGQDYLNAFAADEKAEKTLMETPAYKAYEEAWKAVEATPEYKAYEDAKKAMEATPEYKAKEEAWEAYWKSRWR